MLKKTEKTLLKSIIILGILSFFLTLVSFSYATAIVNFRLIKSYLLSPGLLILNFLPIFIVGLIVWAASNSLGLSFILTGLLVNLGGLANRSKLTYRDDPLIFSDVFLAKEAGMMAGKYKLPISPRIVISLALVLLIGWGLKKFYDYKFKTSGQRLGLLALSLLLGLLIGSQIIYKESIYVSLGDRELINPWIESERFQSKGFIYPFVYSSKELLADRMEGYDPARAKQVLAGYDYQNIDKDSRVNIIAIMLEAYNDFSKFEGLEIDEGVYDFFHRLQEDSLSGNIVTNVFAGGTIDTERAFLTGYQNQPNYNKNTNSFVWYLKDQGYYTEAMHPITGSFYNRRNVNEYLGFDNFLYEENKFKDYLEGRDYLGDKDFFKFIIDSYKDKKELKPYFNFSVTYQNHGPYGKQKYHEEDYLRMKEGYSQEKFNIINNYLYGIKKTGEALEELISYFSQEEEPVLVVLFGDHNPWLGEENSVYKMLNIDMDPSSSQGFLNYYETPFIIWGNQSARNISQNPLKGRLDNIGPSYLMAEVFQALGWKGDQYMQLVSEMKEQLPIQHRLYFKQDGKYIEELEGKSLEAYMDYRMAEFYQARNFREDR